MQLSSPVAKSEPLTVLVVDGSNPQALDATFALIERLATEKPGGTLGLPLWSGQLESLLELSADKNWKPPDQYAPFFARILRIAQGKGLRVAGVAPPIFSLPPRPPNNLFRSIVGLPPIDMEEWARQHRQIIDQNYHGLLVMAAYHGCDWTVCPMETWPDLERALNRIGKDYHLFVNGEPKRLLRLSHLARWWARLFGH